MKRKLLLLITMLTLMISCRDIYYWTNGFVDDVTLNAHSVELVLGKDASFKLEATISPLSAPNRKVIWSSSDWSVATVSKDGVVVPKSIGEAIITVKTDDGEYTDDCRVRVVAATDVVD